MGSFNIQRLACNMSIHRVEQRNWGKFRYKGHCFISVLIWGEVRMRIPEKKAGKTPLDGHPWIDTYAFTQ